MEVILIESIAENPPHKRANKSFWGDVDRLGR